MANATIETKNGTKIVVEGTPEEVAKVLAIYNTKDDFQPIQKEVREREFKKFTKRNNAARPTIADRLGELIEAGFFEKSVGLAEVKAKLEEQGNFIPITTISGYALGLVKRKELRRNKDESGMWKYSKW